VTETQWSVTFLGVIAAATLLMALIQIGLIVMGLRLARRVNEITTEVQREIRPTIAKISAVTDDAARAAAIAVTQAQRVEHVLSDIGSKADRVISVASHAMLVPAREGIALVSALRAVLAVVRSGNHRRKRRSREAEEQALFIG
jgi:hypothetical protein